MYSLSPERKRFGIVGLVKVAVCQAGGLANLVAFYTVRRDSERSVWLPA